MNTYQTWICGDRDTMETIEAESSFDARKYLATKYNVELTDCVARRFWEEDREEHLI